MQYLCLWLQSIQVAAYQTSGLASTDHPPPPLRPLPGVVYCDGSVVPVKQTVSTLYASRPTWQTEHATSTLSDCGGVQCVATVMMLAGVVFFGILIGSLGEIVQHASTRARQAQMFRRKFEDVEAWMRMRRLPKFTQKKIR